MILDNPDSRRALRSLVQTFVALALVGLLFWLTSLLRGDSGGLEGISRGALIIIGVGTFMYGAENVGRAISFKVGPAGIEGDVGGDNAS